jgi:positive regulator of sigma E activity
MSTEQGVVKQVEPGWAWVKAKRLGATSGCGCYDHCHTIEGGNKMVIKAVNQVQAQKGDVVVLYLSTSAKFNASPLSTFCLSWDSLQEYSRQTFFRT